MDSCPTLHLGLRRTMVLFLLSLSVPIAAPANVIISSFGPGNGYDLNGGLSISTIGSANRYETATAVSFTPSSTYTLSQIDLALGYVSGTNSFVVKLVNDNSGPVGSLIETWVFSAPTFLQADLNTLAPVTSIVLNGGDSYWIVVLPGGSDTWGAWNHPSPDTFVGELAGSRDGGSTWYPPVVGVGPAYDVVGNLSTPEPASSVPVGVALVALAIGRRLWMRRSKACNRFLA